MMPSVSTVLAWRWGVATLLRLGAVGTVAWTLWTWVPTLMGQLVLAPLNGRTPFFFLDASVATAATAIQARQQFYANLRLDGVLVVASIAVWLLAPRLAALVARMPRPLERCPACRYSLDGLSVGQCPECGAGLAPVSPAAPSAAHPPARSDTGGSPA